MVPQARSVAAQGGVGAPVPVQVGVSTTRAGKGLNPTAECCTSICELRRTKPRGNQASPEGERRVEKPRPKAEQQRAAGGRAATTQTHNAVRLDSYLVPGSRVCTCQLSARFMFSDYPSENRVTPRSLRLALLRRGRLDGIGERRVCVGKRIARRIGQVGSGGRTRRRAPQQPRTNTAREY